MNVSRNEISEIDLPPLQNLLELSVNENKVQTFRIYSTVPKLRLVSLKENEISEIEGLENVPYLRELYLDSNRIGCMKESINKCRYLNVLSLSCNTINKYLI